MTHTEAEIIALAKECGALTHMESGLLYFEPSQLQAFAARLSAPDAGSPVSDDGCGLKRPDTVRDTARRLYEQVANQTPWAKTDNATKREWIDKAKLAQPVQPAQNPKFTMAEWEAHARKHQWRFDGATNTGVDAQSSQPSPELLAVVEAADNYYRRYCQDEASEDGCEVTGCTLSQHEDAVALRDALTALEAA